MAIFKLRGVFVIMTSWKNHPLQADISEVRIPIRTNKVVLIFFIIHSINTILEIWDIQITIFYWIVPVCGTFLKYIFLKILICFVQLK